MKLEYEQAKYMSTLAKELKKRPLKNAKNKHKWFFTLPSLSIVSPTLHNQYLYKAFKKHEERLRVTPPHEFPDPSSKDLRELCPWVQSAFHLRLPAGFREEDDQNVLV